MRSRHTSSPEHAVPLTTACASQRGRGGGSSAAVAAGSATGEGHGPSHWQEHPGVKGKAEGRPALPRLSPCTPALATSCAALGRMPWPIASSPPHVRDAGRKLRGLAEQGALAHAVAQAHDRHAGQEGHESGGRCSGRRVWLRCHAGRARRAVASTSEQSGFQESGRGRRRAGTGQRVEGEVKGGHGGHGEGESQVANADARAGGQGVRESDRQRQRREAERQVAEREETVHVKAWVSNVEVVRCNGGGRDGFEDARPEPRVCAAAARN
jgi:hypothetical protein